MINLPETESAFSQLTSNMAHGDGMHTLYRPAVGSSSRIIGEEEFNPLKHNPLHVNPLSFGGIVTGKNHVQVVNPNKPVATNLVIHRCVDALEDSQVAAAKAILMDGMATTMEQVALDAGMGNVVTRYVVGHPLDYDWDDIRNEIVPAETEEDTAEEIRTISSEGLTFIFSTFDDLRFDEKDFLQGAVAVKINHARDLYVTPGQGVIPAGEIREVDTDDPEELEVVNEILAGYHASIENSLNAAGLLVARVIFDGSGEYGIDIDKTDTELSTKIIELAQAN